MSGAKEELKNYFDSYKKSIIAILFVLSYLAVGLSLYYNVPAFTLHWLIFGLVAVIIPSGLTCMYDYSSKFVQPDCRQKANVVKVIIKSTLFYWLADCVYMAIFNGWTTWIYILGILFIILVLLNLASAFLGNYKRNAIINFFDAADLLLGLAATVYLIYIIPGNLQSLQTIITTIVAAVYGGLLTLVGVAWTIKHSTKERELMEQKREVEKQEEERKKFIPYVKVVLNKNQSMKYRCIQVEYIENFNFNSEENVASIKDKTFYAIQIHDVCLKNVSQNNIILKGIWIDEKYYRLSVEYILEPNELLNIGITKNEHINFINKIKKVAICAEDILGNGYKILFKFDLNLGKNFPIPFMEDCDYKAWLYECKITSCMLPQQVIGGEQ